MSKFVSDDTLTPAGYFQLTSLATARTVPGGGRVAIIQCEDQNIRWRDDGTDPTAAVGMLLRAGAEMWYVGDLKKLRVIEVAVGAKLNISLYS